jgi:NADH-quinone oxidoreductase subunit A
VGLKNLYRVGWDMLIDYLPILFFLAIAIGFAVFAVVASSLLGQKKPSAAKQAPYECGMPTIGPTYIRIPIKYYIFAMLFLLFDIEVVFLYPLAVVYKELKIVAFLAMAVFIAILVVAYIYIWKKGALEWE